MNLPWPRQSRNRNEIILNAAVSFAKAGCDEGDSESDRFSDLAMAAAGGATNRPCHRPKRRRALIHSRKIWPPTRKAMFIAADPRGDLNRVAEVRAVVNNGALLSPEQLRAGQ